MRIKIGNKVYKSDLSRGEVLAELDELSDGAAKSAKVEQKTEEGWVSVSIRWTENGSRLGVANA